MKSVLQRVTNASVTVDDIIVGQIQQGLLVYLGVENGDDDTDVTFLARKIPKLRLFEDEAGKINVSVVDRQASILVISQFTLCADLTKGNRPSFNPAATPERARELYERFVALLERQGIVVATGVFGAKMYVSYTNEGPVTILLDSPKKHVDAIR